MTKKKDSREECEIENDNRDVYKVETSTNNNTIAISRTNSKRDKRDDEVTIAFGRTSEAMFILLIS